MKYKLQMKLCGDLILREKCVPVDDASKFVGVLDEIFANICKAIDTSK